MASSADSPTPIAPPTRRATPLSWLGVTAGARAGSALVLLGALLVGYAGLWQLGVAPGSRVTLPAPVALQEPPTPLVIGTRAVRTAIPLPPRDPASVAAAATQPATAFPRPAPTRLPATPARAAPAYAPADGGDRTDATLYPQPGYAVRLSIPAIKIDTRVAQAGLKKDAQGVLEWETRPFVAVHYGDLTALVGGVGNAVIAGHVATLYEGNVFWSLYRVHAGDEVKIWDDQQRLHEFVVDGVRLVQPDDVAIMQPTLTPTLTLITCGGTFDPRTRQFSDRLVVTARPLPATPSQQPNGA